MPVPFDLTVRLFGWIGQRSRWTTPHHRGGRADHERYECPLSLDENVLIRRNITVPVNLKDRDAFHLTIEEYLLALVSLIEDLVRTRPLLLLFFSLI